MDTLVANSLAGRQLIVWMLAAFAGLALLLAIVGIYGLISYITTQRTAEVGVRIALGASRPHVVGMVLKNASSWVAIGSAIGVLLSLSTTVMLKHFFVNLGTGEAASLGITILALLAFGAVAAAVPAFRAASVSPIRALRNE